MTSEKLPRRTRNKLDKRARIQRAALELFSRDGFEQTTTKAIAEEAEVAAGTIFLYATDKADLLVLATHDELLRIVEERFATMPDAALIEQLLHVFGGFLAFYMRHGKLAPTMIQTLLVNEGRSALELDRLTIATLGRIAALVEHAQKSGALDEDVPPLLLAQNFFALYFSSLAAWLRKFVHTSEETLGLLRVALELQLRGLQRR